MCPAQTPPRKLDTPQNLETAPRLLRVLLPRCAIETNGGQFHLKSYIQEAAWRAGVHLPLAGVNNHKSKIERIEALEIPISEGEILFHESQKLLIEQLLEFPEGRNDDAPDSLAGAYKMSRLARKITRRNHHQPLYKRTKL